MRPNRIPTSTESSTVNEDLSSAVFWCLVRKYREDEECRRTPPAPLALVGAYLHRPDALTDGWRAYHATRRASSVIFSSRRPLSLLVRSSPAVYDWPKFGRRLRCGRAFTPRRTPSRRLLIQSPACSDASSTALAPAPGLGHVIPNTIAVDKPQHNAPTPLLLTITRAYHWT